MSHSQWSLSKFAQSTVGYDAIFSCPNHFYWHIQDYRAYVDLVLALTNRSEPQAIRFLFNIFDTYGYGELSTEAMKHYFNSHEEQTSREFENFYAEMCDLIKPQNPDFITLDDLLRS